MHIATNTIPKIPGEDKYVYTAVQSENRAYGFSRPNATSDSISSIRPWSI
jgi:hypothetical protein